MARESSGESRQAEAISCPKASSVQSFASFMAWYSLWPNKKIASQDSVITRPLHSCHCSADSGAHLGQGKCCFMQPHFDSRSSLLKSVHTEIWCTYMICIYIYECVDIYIWTRCPFILTSPNVNAAESRLSIWWVAILYDFLPSAMIVLPAGLKKRAVRDDVQITGCK